MKHRYWAFISYSHLDESWARWLHKALETYVVPRRLVGRAHPDGSIPRRLFPIFRDREDLASSAELGAVIDKALTESRYLIVICSPHSARSRWVDEEIRRFKALGRERRVLALIIDGEPNSANPETECFPPALKLRTLVDGRLGPAAVEPIAADVRPGRDHRYGALIRLLAGLIEVGFDELRQRVQPPFSARYSPNGLRTPSCGSCSAGPCLPSMPPGRRWPTAAAVSRTPPTVQAGPTCCWC